MNLGTTFNRTGKPSVCFNCPDRAPGCHGGCEKYKAEVATRQNSAEQQQKRLNIFMDDYRREHKKAR